MRIWVTTIALVLAFQYKLDANQPNVLVIMTDDQGYGDFSCHGNPIADTPNIDRLAAASVRMTDFHVAPMCTPTRGQLMTGIDAFRNGAINVSSGRTLLRPELDTMASVFQRAGYRTAIFGKWHLGDNYPYRPEDRGFETTIWFPSSHINSLPDFWDNDYFDDTYICNGVRKKLTGYCTDIFFDQAIQWIQSAESASGPFFGYIALNAAHWPLFVPDRYRSPVRLAMEQHPQVVEHLSPAGRESLVSFLAMGANIDENIGKLDQFLRESNLINNTIVVFLTDNGSTMGEDYFNAGMRGKKTQLWEGGHRVPCFIRWNNKLGSPREIDQLSQVQDLLPTLADLVGIADIPAELDGVSWAPVLQGKQEQHDDRMLVINYSRMPTFRVSYTALSPAIPQRDGAAVLWKSWRLLENRQLYDLSTDPHQDRDVAAENPEIFTKMSAHLQAWWTGVEPTVSDAQRVIIGDDKENPLLLSACEWLDVFVDQQRQVRAGEPKNGIWYLNVAHSGRYRFELRRWPQESGLKLEVGLAATQVTDGEYVAGRSLPIAKAKIQAGNYQAVGVPDAFSQSIVFAIDLPEGPLELQTWFLDAQDRELCGAYYVTVERLMP